MSAIVYRQYGGPEVLELVELPEPKVAQSSLLVRVKAAALNPADIGMQAGVADGIIDAWFPVIPGWDVAGIVDAVFDSARRGVLGSTAALHSEGVRVFSIADGGPGVTTIFARPDQADLISLVDLVEAERLVVRVAATYPLASAAAAQKALQQGRLSGKIILEPG
jgi:NADPH:quinone reductase-like Zn-dependent oxidoreductase